ncbi:MAG: DUF6489 family protein [Rhodospirillum sp.]|nr:DUF6489 family protein [Rhodospirillum sp.]MCF8491632.1 DUF6489 family protein [Rhodospirillum sp.]MCF8500127.1 DUF6489 family protein [Rhodospirillum sp.]
MKLTVDVDCTPEEARTFLGLPDVKPMQEALMTQIQERMATNLNAMDPDTLFKTWFPTQVQNLGNLQEFFWNQFANATRSAGSGSVPKTED